MAKIEKIVTTTIRVENNKFDYTSIMSFQTEHYIGEWDSNEDGYAIFRKDRARYIDDKVYMTFPDDLEELMNEVKSLTGEEITDVYDERIIRITFNIPM